MLGWPWLVREIALDVHGGTLQVPLGQCDNVTRQLWLMTRAE
jgi:hypothetical protein